MLKSQILIGAHMSIAGGLDQAILRGASIGCNTIQIFTQNNRRWGISQPITKNAAINFKEAQQNNNISVVVAHSSYLINLASVSQQIAEKSEDALVQELDRCEQLGIPYLVLHPGSGLDQNQAIEQISRRITVAINRAESNTLILLETMAGQGNSVGANFEQIKQLISLINRPNNLGVCFDTCHAWASGYDFSNLEKYNEMWNIFNQIIGFHNLKAMHINDSKTAFGSRVDRHANIGEGTLGIEPFRLIMNDTRFLAIPKILETPKNNLDDDVKNLATLKSLIKKQEEKD